MRIWVFTDSFLPYISGVSSAVFNQANELASRGHRISIFHPSRHKNDKEYLVEGLHPSISLHGLPFSFPLRSVPKLRLTVPLFFYTYRRLKQAPPDLIHCHTEWGCGLEGMLLGRWKKVPVIGTFHTFFAEPDYLRQVNLPTWPIMRKITWKYSIAFFNRCQRIISPSRSVQKHLVDKGISKEPILLSNGIESVSIRPRHEILELRREMGIDGFAFVYVGRVSPEKSMDIALRAFAKVHSQRPNAKFVIVGNGPSDELVDRLARELGISDALVRTGRVEREKLMRENYPLLGEVFVTASKTENQPISILEAMAFGLPLVGPKAKGIPELVLHGDNGFIFEPDNVDEMAERMIQTMDDRELRESMSKRSLQLASTHKINHIGDQLESIYQGVVEE